MSALPSLSFPTIFQALAAALAASLVAVPLEAEPGVHVGSRRMVRKEADMRSDERAKSGAAPSSSLLLGTLVQLHTNEHVALGEDEPPRARFDALLSDRTTGEHRSLDPRLLDLLRSLAAEVPGARIELVSGFRSPKLNERLRKKGRNVASHSQHSLGHAVDFRIVPPAAGAEGVSLPLEPAVVEKMIRDRGWEGGVGIYPGKTDRFVHADVGPNRRWLGK